MKWLYLGITPVPPGMTPSGPSDFSLQSLTQNVNKYAEAATSIVTSGTSVTLTPTQVLAKNIVLRAGASGAFTINLPSTTSILDALGPTMPLDGTFFFELSVWNDGTGQVGTLTPGDTSTVVVLNDVLVPTDTTCKWMVRVDPVVSSSIGRPTTLTITKTSTAVSVGIAGSGTVVSVAQTVPVEFNVSGSPVTTTGTLAITKANETANTVWAGPTSGGAAQPTFRALVLADLPGGVGLGSVTSVAQTVPPEFTISGSPVTTSGTLVIGKATETANTVWAGPTTGSPAQPTFRTLVTGDLPAGIGTVTSVALAVPGEFTVSGSPVTSAGTLTIGKATETANTVWAGPTSGAAAQPTFRALNQSELVPAGWFTLTDGATITPNCANGPKQTVTLGGNRTIAAPTNIPGDGFELWLLIKQDGTGSRTATWNAIYVFFSSGAKTLTTTANAVDLAACVYQQATGTFYCQLSTNGL